MAARDDEDLPPVPRSKRPLDTSKRPETVTTESSMRSLLKEKFGEVEMDATDLSQLQNGIENFAFTLMQFVIEQRRKSEATETINKAKKPTKATRVTSDEIWSAMAAIPSLRPVALRFVALGLVPAPFVKHFQYATPIAPTDDFSPDISDDDMIDDSNDGLNPFLFGPTSSASQDPTSEPKDDEHHYHVD